MSEILFDWLKLGLMAKYDDLWMRIERVKMMTY